MILIVIAITSWFLVYIIFFRIKIFFLEKRKKKNFDFWSENLFNFLERKIYISDFAKLICNILGKPNRILNLPKLFTRFIAKAGDFLPIPINTERLLKLTENYEVSNLKIKNAINKNLPLSSTEGIKKTFESFVQ